MVVLSSFPVRRSEQVFSAQIAHRSAGLDVVIVHALSISCLTHVQSVELYMTGFRVLGVGGVGVGSVGEGNAGVKIAGMGHYGVGCAFGNAGVGCAGVGSAVMGSADVGSHGSWF